MCGLQKHNLLLKLLIKIKQKRIRKGTEISELEKSIKDLEESLKSQRALLAKRKPNYEKRLKESREAKEGRAKRNNTRVLCTQADDVSASGSAASAFVSPLKKRSRVSDSADCASELKSDFEKSTESDAEEEASDAVESPKKKRKVVSEDEKAAIKAKKDAEKAEREAEKARKEAERKAEKAKKEELARQRKAVAEERKMFRQKI